MAECKVEFNEELLEEIVERKIKEYLEQNDTPKQTEDRGYFKEAIKYITDSYRAGHCPYSKGGTSIYWTHIRSLVYCHYGCNKLKDMKPEWKDDANKLAMELFDMVRKKEPEKPEEILSLIFDGGGNSDCELYYRCPHCNKEYKGYGYLLAKGIMKGDIFECEKCHKKIKY